MNPDLEPVEPIDPPDNTGRITESRRRCGSGRQRSPAALAILYSNLRTTPEVGKKPSTDYTDLICVICGLQTSLPKPLSHNFLRIAFVAVNLVIEATHFFGRDRIRQLRQYFPERGNAC